MTKVLFIMSSFNIGGIEISMLRIAMNLKNNNIDVSFLITTSKGIWFEKLNESNFEVFFVDGYSLLIPWLHAIKVGKILARNKFDVIFVVFDELTQSVLSMIDNKTVVIPLLRNAHPDVYRIGLSNSSRWNLAIGNSNKIAFEAKQIVSNKTIKVIANSTFVPESICYKTIQDWQDEIKLIFVGRLVHESKGVYLLPQILNLAISNGLNVSLTIVGDGVDKQPLLEKFQNLGLLNKVNFIGVKDSKEISQLLLDSHIFIFTSYYEGLPNVVMEAMAHGCIPIVSNLPMITDMLIKDCENGFLVDVGNMTEYVVKIGYLIDNPQKSIEISKNAYETIKNSFSYEYETSQYINIIQDSIARVYNLNKTRNSFFPICFEPYNYKQTLFSFFKKKLYMIVKELGLR